MLALLQRPDVPILPLDTYSSGIQSTRNSRACKVEADQVACRGAHRRAPVAENVRGDDRVLGRDADAVGVSAGVVRPFARPAQRHLVAEYQRYVARAAVCETRRGARAMNTST
eukprot:5950982-Pleurochrysis_carterae.AAC.6